MRWQQITRVLLGLFLAVFGLIVIFGLRGRETPEATARYRSDPDAVVESTGAIVTQAKGAKQDFRVEAERQLTYASGATRLESVKVTVLERAGRNFEVTGAQAEIGDDRSRITMSGDVVMAASDGLTARTEEASYDDGVGRLTAPGPVEFSRERLSGTGVGASFDRDRDVLWIQDQAHVVFLPDAAGQGGMEILSGAAGIARRDRYLRFERSVHIVRPGEVIEAETVMAYLAPHEDRVERLELRGGSRIDGREPVDGGLESMAAESINLEYDETGALRHALLAGAAQVRTAGGAQSPGRTIHAEGIDTGFAPDGVGLTELVAQERVRLDMPAHGEAPARTITAATLDGRGDGRGRLTTARFSGDVVFREQQTAGEAAGGERVARSSVLVMALDADTGQVADVSFPEAMTFEDGRVTATAREAVYQVDAGLVALAGPTTPGARPVVQDEGLVIEANTIDLAVSGRSFTAKGDVRSTAPPATEREGPDDRVRRPGMLAADQTMYITGAELDYDGESGRAVYTGDARLWQADTAVQGDRIELDEPSGDMVASGAVRTSMLLEQTDEQTGASERVASIASAKDMLYDHDARVITYTTSAHVTGPQGDLTASKVEMYLGAEGEQLDRVEAYEKVKLVAPARTAEGERLTYFATDERYVMLGSPVKVIEECRLTTGRILTFYKSTDTITVDGNEEIRTQSTGNQCPEPPVE